MIEPVEYFIYKDFVKTKYTYQYVPILDTICQYMKSSENLFAFKESFKHKSVDINNGNLVYKCLQNGSLFEKYGKAIVLKLYVDEATVVNPIGHSHNKHKYLAVYFRIANLNPAFTSKSNHIFIALVVNYIAISSGIITYEELLSHSGKMFCSNFIKIEEHVPFKCFKIGRFALE
jgi:hypothetical protein